MFSMFYISYLEMKILILIPLLTILSATISSGRIWTDNYGRTVEADVIKVNINRTVLLEFTDKKTKIVSFDTFISKDIQYLEYLHCVNIKKGKYRKKIRSIYFVFIYKA